MPHDPEDEVPVEEGINTLLGVITANDLDTYVLDDLVITAKEQEASSINNQGPEEQLRYLLGGETVRWKEVLDLESVLTLE